jgi:hypothetical protein
VGPAPSGIAAIVIDTPGARYQEPPTFVITDLGTPPGAGATLGPAAVLKGQITAAPPVTAPGADYNQPIVTISGGGGDNTDLKKITDDDLNGAILDAQYNINEGLFATQQTFTRAFLYLAAHQLVEKVLMGMEGLASQYNWLTTSKSVGDVAEAFQIPKYLAEDPMLSHFSKTRYGAMYLQIISPLLVGHTMALPRATLPS